ITKGMTLAVFKAEPTDFFSHPEILAGYHDGYPDLFGAADFGTPSVLGHEILETMSSPDSFGGLTDDDEWSTEESFLGLDHEEGADACGGVGDLSLFTLNKPNGASCELYEPQQYAPIAVTFAPRPNGGDFSQLGTVTAFYLLETAALATTTWDLFTNQTTIENWGAPNGIGFFGKPAAVTSAALGGSFAFMRDGQGAVWQFHNGTFTPLGGVIIGDPTAVTWDDGQIISVFALGTSGALFMKMFAAGNWSGWTVVPTTESYRFSAPPRAYSRAPGTIDVFAAGTNGHLNWFSYNSPGGGWGHNQNGGTISSDLGTIFGAPHHTPVAIAATGSNRLDVFGSSESEIVHRQWTGQWSGDYEARSELNGAGVSGTPAVVWRDSDHIDAFSIDRQGQILHIAGSSTAWFTPDGIPLATDGVGDPVVISPDVQTLWLFYKATDGTLSYLYWNQLDQKWIHASGLNPGGTKLR
ncbi:MAG TPA: hypothetical protein VNO55_00210, partial [Polyangia bacterium]|nr:hypothetical protein [Polyangia bacterium]